MMEITFKHLSKKDFSLLLKWLELPHIKEWWDPHIKYTMELIEKKYEPYTLGFKRRKLSDRIIEKPMHAFIIYYGDLPIGYIQYYNKYDFPPEQNYDLNDLPTSCAALDYYIGEVEYIGKGIGTKILDQFLSKYIFTKFEYAFVDPETANIRAIKAYSKAGFSKFKLVNDDSITIMIAKARNH